GRRSRLQPDGIDRVVREAGAVDLERVGAGGEALHLEASVGAGSRARRAVAGTRALRTGAAEAARAEAEERRAAAAADAGRPTDGKLRAGHGPVRRVRHDAVEHEAAAEADRQARPRAAPRPR